MNTNALQLLEATDTIRRGLQHGALLGGFILLALGGSSALHSPAALNIGMIGLGVGLIALAAVVKQIWELEYKGHRIRFENSAIWAEKLFIDGELVARGGFGYRMELRGDIKRGDGMGDQIIARSGAGLLRFKCRIFVEHESQA